jgi:hypothetical protein
MSDNLLKKALQSIGRDTCPFCGEVLTTDGDCCMAFEIMNYLIMPNRSWPPFTCANCGTQEGSYITVCSPCYRRLTHPGDCSCDFCCIDRRKLKDIHGGQEKGGEDG